MKRELYGYYLPGVGGSWLLALILVLGQFAASPVQILTNLQSASYFAAMLFPFVFVAIASSRSARRGAYSSDADAFVPMNRPDFGTLNPVIFFILLAMAVLALGILIEPLTSLLPMPDRIKVIFERAFRDTNLYDSLVATSILAPLCEETLCRGVMMRGMLKYVAPWKAIFWSSLIFAMIHLNPWQAIPAFVFGLFFGWVYYRTRSLWATIFLHFLNNFSSWLMMRLLFPEAGVDQGLKDMIPASKYVYLFIVSLLLIIEVIFIFARTLKRTEQ